MSPKGLLFSLIIPVLLSSCALRSVSTGLTKYQEAVLHYETKDYYEALRLFEEALPLLRGKKEEASVHFYCAYCHFHQKKYIQCADRFNYFSETFLGDPRVEEAVYMRSHALYVGSPDVRLDQTSTREAVHALLDYLDCYPEGKHVEQAGVQLETLNRKLALKELNSAKLYHQLTHYRAAVVTLNNFQKDFPGSVYDEEASYVKANAQYRHFKKEGADQKKLWRVAIKYCQEFLNHYPDSEYALTVRAMYKDLSSIDEPENP
ncbi:MAG: outer membrane protein assembly factor BamD [Amoebophilaceae bacterium]|jgi:outer membrane protein assembly factor BamD|nr:outer membrane protein assembly factor BamD [Amoebophilaceae bacterium]